MTKKNLTPRNRLLAAVHVTAKKLGMAEDDRRAFQEKATGQASCKNMTDAQLNYLLSQMDKLQNKPLKPRKKSFNAQPEARARKVIAMWQQLFESGVVQASEMTALNNFVYRQVDISALNWVKDNKDFDALFTALRSMAKRNGVSFNE